jgi:predicted ester cyclase
MSTADQIRADSRAWFDEVWTQGKTETIDRLMAADCIGHGLPQMQSRGPAGFKAFYDHFRGGFSSIVMNVEAILVEGDMSVVRFTARCKPDGGSFGLAPTGATVTIAGMVMIRWKDGQMVEGWNSFDAAGMTEQLNAAAAGRA